MTLVYHIRHMSLLPKKRCVTYIHDPNTTLTFDLKVEFIGFMTWLCVWATASFVLWHSHTMLCIMDDVSCTCMTSVWPWPLTSISKLYFHNEFVSGQGRLACWHRPTKFGIYMGVSPWDNMCRFLTFVWPWTLTYT